MRENSLIYGIALGSALFAALFVAGQIPYMFLYALALAGAIPLLMLYRSLHSLRGEVLMASRSVEAGQPVAVTFKIENPGRGRFPYLELTTGSAVFSDQSMFLNLGPGEAREVPTEIVCARRGTYDLASISVATGDPFGFFRISKPLAQGGLLKVYPRLRDLDNEVLPAYRRPGGHLTPSATHDDPSENERLREWRSGDSMRNIHWKQTVRQGAIIVKSMERAADTELALFVDMSLESYRQDRERRLEDLAVELAASLAFSRLKSNHPVRVFAGSSGDGWHRAGHFKDYESVLDWLIDLAPVRRESVYHDLRMQSYTLPAGTSINVASPALSLAEADFLLSLKKRGFPVTVFHLRLHPPDTTVELLLGRLRRSGVNVHVLYPAERRHSHVASL